MTILDLLLAVSWSLVWQLPWIVGLVVAWLLYRRWKTSAAGFTVLALGLLIIWAVAGPLIMVEVWGARWHPGFGVVVGVGPLASFAIGFLGNVISIALVLFLAMALLRLMRDLSENGERR
jgi:hypothetical protein